MRKYQYNEKIIINKLPLSLKIICCLTGIFFLIELIFGIMIKSLALQADALHMASDFISIIIALYSQKVLNNKANNTYTYGYKRSEIVGAFANTIFLLSSCLFISLESIHKFIDLKNGNQLVTNIPQLLLVGSLGLFINIISIIILHFCSNTNINQESDELLNIIEKGDGHGHGHGHGHGQGQGHGHGHNHSINQSQNIRGVFLHILGDLIGSIGVIISGLIMYFWEDFGFNENSKLKYISDPLSSLLIVILIINSTFKLFKECYHILMQGTPLSININKIKTKILEINGILNLHDSHIWQLNNDNIIFTSHIEYDKSFNYIDLTDRIKTILLENKIKKSTIQLEYCLNDCIHNETDNCRCHDIFIK
tara:strand:+ start:345 stop:1445 length:1101 start_codon:yes stop_codon:yes gene_type:complete